MEMILLSFISDEEVNLLHSGWQDHDMCCMHSVCRGKLTTCLYSGSFGCKPCGQLVELKLQVLKLEKQLIYCGPSVRLSVLLQQGIIL